MPLSLWIYAVLENLCNKLTNTQCTEFTILDFLRSHNII